MPMPVFDELPPLPVNPHRPGKSENDFPALLSRVYKLADQAVTQLESMSGGPMVDDSLADSRIKRLTNQIGALTRLARVLPLLASAEQTAVVRDKQGEAVSDWDDEKLAAVARAIQARNT